MYVGLRAAVLVWFGTAAAVVAGAPDVHLHLHHLYLGWGSRSGQVTGYALCVC